VHELLKHVLRAPSDAHIAAGGSGLSVHFENDESLGAASPRGKDVLHCTVYTREAENAIVIRSAPYVIRQD
jgi:hypothetical protein